MSSYTYLRKRELEKAPDYGRVVAALSLAELRDELELGRGEPAYQEAVRAELGRRKGGS